MKKLLNLSIVGPLSAFILISIIIALTTNRFLEPNNLRNIALQVSIVSLMSIGSTLVIIVGGIDLSPGSMISLLTMILAVCIKFFGLPIYFVIILIIILGGVLGFVNGLMTSYLRIPAFITTLATMSIFRGLAFTINRGSPIFSLSPVLQDMFYGRLLGLPVVFYYIIFFFTLFAFVMKYTEFGRRLYAVGGNYSAARYSGIKVKSVTAYAFIAAGFMAGVAAVLMAARLNSGSPNYGVGMELSAIAAAVIGGASLSGGKGNVLATLIGALIIVIVQNGLNLHAVPTAIQQITLGTIILIAVLVDMWRSEISGLFSGLLRSVITKKGQDNDYSLN